MPARGDSAFDGGPCSPMVAVGLEVTGKQGGLAKLEPQRPDDGADAQPAYGVTFQRYRVRTYMTLPHVLRPFVRLPRLKDFLVVSRPSMDASGGLANYRAAVPKSVRSRAPFLVVVDRPGLEPPPEERKYHWVEFALPDVFKVDVSPYASFQDYVQRHLRKNRRRAYNVRQASLRGPGGEPRVLFDYVPLEPGNQALVDELWGLYQKTSQRHGFQVLSRRDFYRVHLGGTPGLSLMLVRDAATGALVTFATGVRTGDTIVSMWCGTDYDNPLSRECSTYINAQYEFIRIAIQTPGVRWVDCGAQLRQMKTGVGCEAYPVAGYVRCTSRPMKALVKRMMQAYFNPAKLLTDA